MHLSGSDEVDSKREVQLQAGESVMSDDGNPEETRLGRKWNAAILFVAKRINLQTKHIKNREEWEIETSEHVDIIGEQIFEALEQLWIENGGTPP
jgi:hypothetical protein